MARNLLKSGAFKEVYVWNRSADKCAELVAEGAKTAGSAAEVVAACDITFACLSDPAAALACLEAPGGVLDGISPGKVRWASRHQRSAQLTQPISTMCRRMLLPMHYSDAGFKRFSIFLIGGLVGLTGCSLLKD